MPDFFADHESGVIGDYYDTTLTANGGVVTVNAAAALNGTNFGLSATVGAANAVARGRKNIPTPLGSTYTVEFYFDPNGIAIDDGGVDDEEFFELQGPGNGTILFAQILNNGGYEMEVRVNDDNSVQFNSANVSISDAPHKITIVINKASSDVASDGSVSFSIDDVLQDTIAGLDFFTQYEAIAKMVAGLSGTEAGTVGTVYLDEISGTSPAASTSGLLRIPSTVLGTGADAEIASISADGDSIYLAAINTFNFPTLIKIDADLLSIGSVVFDPGDGDNIGVQCGLFDEDVVWVAGNFGGINKVEKSEDSGGSFTPKNDSSTGDVRAFVVGPLNDNTVLIFDVDNGDLLETVDDGATWTTINAAVTPTVNAIDRLAINPQEAVFGNEGAATNSIDYSVNTGANLEDYQVAPYPNVDATKVIVN